MGRGVKDVADLGGHAVWEQLEDLEAYTVPGWERPSAPEVPDVPKDLSQRFGPDEGEPSPSGRAAPPRGDRAEGEGRAIRDEVTSPGPHDRKDGTPRGTDSGGNVMRWGAIDPLDEIDLPPFPVDALPSRWGEYVSALATQTQTPGDLPGMVLLGVLATAMQGKYRVRSWPGGWYEPLCLWPVPVLPPGNRKTSIMDSMLGPVRSYERRAREDEGPKHSEAVAQREAIATELGRLRKRAARADATEEDQQAAATVAEKLAKLPTSFPPMRLVASDVTPEATAALLHEHGRITLATSEGGEVFANVTGRYSNGSANLELYLKAHAGEEHTVDRITRQGLFIPRATATLVLSVQPDVLRALGESSEMRGRGFLARVLWSLPGSPVGFRVARPPPVPDELSTWYERSVAALLSLPGQRDGTGAWVPRLIDLSPEASALLEGLMVELEVRKRQDEGDLAPIVDWAEKLHGAALRIAALLHAAERPGMEPSGRAVSAETMERAISLARYFIPHALAAFALMDGGGETARRARRVVGWLRRHRHQEATERDLWRALGQSKLFGSVEDLRPVLEELAQRGYLRLAPEDPHPGPGRKPSPRWLVHPEVCGIAATALVEEV